MDSQAQTKFNIAPLLVLQLGSFGTSKEPLGNLVLVQVVSIIGYVIMQWLDWLKSGFYGQDIYI